MGAVETMKRTVELQELLNTYDEVKKCFCGNWSVPFNHTMYEEYFDEENNVEVTLELINFPVFKCIECEEVTYTPLDFLNVYKSAVETYKTTQELVYDCSKKNS